jgi:hypothetical protein
MFLHVFFLFPETSQKPLEEVDTIFDDSTSGSIRFLGTPAWKTHVDTHTRRFERGEMDAEEKIGRAELEHQEVGEEKVGSGDKKVETV